MKTKILMIGTLLVTQTACSGISSLSVHDGGEFFEMRGTPQGIRAYNDGQSGLITTGKSTPDAQTDYFATRREQAAQRLRRYVSTTKKQGVK